MLKWNSSPGGVASGTSPTRIASQPTRTISDQMIAHLTADPAEQALLGAARDYEPHLRLADLDERRIQAVVRARGIDFATAFLFDRVRSSDLHGPMIDAVDRWCAERAPQSPPRRRSEILVAIVPGFLYREYPDSGADGRMLRQAAEQLGWECQSIPVASTGRLRENAETILNWLQQHVGRPTILASISKGGSDLAAALQREGALSVFRDVIGWVNVCGIIRGSPVVDRVSKQWLTMAGFRILFALRRWSFASVMDLKSKGGVLRGLDERCGRVRPIHVLGFPLESHFVSPRLRRFHRLLADSGPNDGAIVLEDSIRSPGLVYPVWGADHYMRPRFRTQPLCAGLFRYLGSQIEVESERA